MKNLTLSSRIFTHIRSEVVKSFVKGLIFALALITTLARGETQSEMLRSLDALLQSNSTIELVQALQKAPDSEQLMDWLRQRAEEGYVVAQYALSQRLVARNKREALAWRFLALINETLDVNECNGYRNADPVMRLIRGFGGGAFAINEGEWLLYADAVDDSLRIALRHNTGAQGKQPPWWICAPGESNPSEDRLRPEPSRTEQRHWNWSERQSRDRGISMEIRFNANLNPDHYRTWKLDETYWKGKLNSDWTTNLNQAYFSAVWLDDDTLLFGGYRIIRAPGSAKKYDPTLSVGPSHGADHAICRTGIWPVLLQGIHQLLRKAR